MGELLVSGPKQARQGHHLPRFVPVPGSEGTFWAFRSTLSVFDHMLLHVEGRNVVLMTLGFFLGRLLFPASKICWNKPVEISIYSYIYMKTLVKMGDSPCQTAGFLASTGLILCISTSLEEFWIWHPSSGSSSNIKHTPFETPSTTWISVSPRQLLMFAQNTATSTLEESFVQIPFPAKSHGKTTIHPVDGSEIRLTSWGKGSLSHYLQGFIHVRWLGMGFLNHQQSVYLYQDDSKVNGTPLKSNERMDPQTLAGLPFSFSQHFKSVYSSKISPGGSMARTSNWLSIRGSWFSLTNPKEVHF